MTEVPDADRFEQMSRDIAASKAAIEALQDLVDAARERVIADEALITLDHDRIGGLEDRVDLDGVKIAELQAEGLLSAKHAADLEEALRSSRRIGAAIGVVMASCKVSEKDAFQILQKASMDGNRKLRTLADEIVLTGDVNSLQTGDPRIARQRLRPGKHGESPRKVAIPPPR